MKIISVNVGEKRTQPKGDGLEITGIYKIPTRAAVHVSALGIPGDVICDHKNHGGPDQAIYIYGEPDYEWWSAQLGRAVGPGTFGENLTVSEFESAQYNIGDRLHVGGVILEFSAPRIPCSTLARRMQDPMFVKRFREAERPGMYCRVIQEGTVQAGDEAHIVPTSGPTVASLEVFREHQSREKHVETLRLILQSPIAVRERKDVEEDLHRLGGAGSQP